MNKNSTIKEILDVINNAKRPLFICHENADADSYGSAFGLREAIGRLDCNVVSATDLVWPFDLLGFEGTINDLSEEENDLYVFVDCGDEIRSGASICEQLKEDVTTVNIDHHQSNTYYGDYNYVMDRSSTCEMIFDILMEQTDTLSKKTANYLYSGIVGDTGLFVHGYTSPKTHYTAGKLMEFGADFNRISIILYRTISLGSAMLTGKLYENFELFDEGIAISYVTMKNFEETNSKYEDSERLISSIFNIDGVNIGILLKQLDDNTFKSSMRSTDEYDISKLAIANGGGGHKQAAGCKFTGNIEDIKKDIIKQIRELGIV